MRYVRLLLLWVGALAMVRPVAAQAQSVRPGADFVVIVHEDNPERAIARESLSKLFLKRTVKWPNGMAAEPVDLGQHDNARAAFTKAVHRRSVSAIRAFWRQQIFSARDVPPPEKSSDTIVIELVRQHRGAVGYVAATTPLVAGVRPLAVEGM